MLKLKTKKSDNLDLLNASFRDPSGFLYQRQGILYRQINQVFKEDYDWFISSGLYQNLIKNHWLIPHQSVGLDKAFNSQAYKIIKPETIPFISYPYEWSFSMLKDAAILTLDLQKTALNYQMSLKDASAYNIQFVDGQPILIDTLSFEKYKSGQPWVAYRQFCQHFLAPLLLMVYTDIRLSQLLRLYLDGIPLDLTSKLLSKKTYFNFSILSHLHLHAKTQSHFADKKVDLKKIKSTISQTQLLALIDSLYSTINQLKLKSTKTQWADYYTFTNYDKEAFNSKTAIIKKLTKKLAVKTVLDLGANDGYFSRQISQNKDLVVACDVDPIAVEKNYLQLKKNQEKNILPLLVDLTNPPADIGWANKERKAFINRSSFDLVMALALVHHLAIGNNLPLAKIARFFADLGQYLLVEFVPKEDSQVKKLLVSREDIFTNYNQKNFERTFSFYFRLIDKLKIKNSLRTVYLFEKK